MPIEMVMMKRFGVCQEIHFGIVQSMDQSVLKCDLDDFFFSICLRS